MSVASLPPVAPPFTVTVHAIGFKEIKLPLLHEIDMALPYLLGGQLNVVIMDDAVPAELLDLLKGRSPAEVARFVEAWSYAGSDYEAYIMGEYLAMERVFDPGAEHTEEDDERDYEAGIGQGLEGARMIAQHLDRIRSKIMDTWQVMR